MASDPNQVTLKEYFSGRFDAMEKSLQEYRGETNKKLDDIWTSLSCNRDTVVQCQKNCNANREGINAEISEIKIAQASHHKIDYIARIAAVVTAIYFAYSFLKPVFAAILHTPGVSP